MQGLVTKLVPQFRLDDFGLHFELLRLSLARWSLARLSLWWDTARPLGKDWKTARHRHHGKTQGTSLQRFARRSALVRGHQGSPGITRDHHRLSSRHNREMFHHFGARMLRISRMSVCILSGFQFSPSFFVFSVHVDPKQITKQKGQYKQKMTNVTELSSKHQSLGREFGCVLALDGLRSDIQRRHWLGPPNLSWQAKRPRACEPTCTRPKVSPAKHVLKNSIIRFERQVLSFTLGSQKSKINEPCYSKKSL